MSNHYTARNGLSELATDGQAFGAGDYNQLANSSVAARGAIGAILGGPGVYDGGAATVSDLTSGTSYPAVTLILSDDGGVLWFFKTTTATAITFKVTASSAASLYAVPTTIAGVTPAAATGTVAGVSFLAQATTTTAPANSLLLGAGVIASSKFTSYTAVAAPAGPPLTDVVFGAYTATTVTPTGFLTIVRDGVTYRIPAVVAS